MLKLVVAFLEKLDKAGKLPRSNRPGLAGVVPRPSVRLNIRACLEAIFQVLQITILFVVVVVATYFAGWFFFGNASFLFLGFRLSLVSLSTSVVALIVFFAQVMPFAHDLWSDFSCGNQVPVGKSIASVPTVQKPALKAKLKPVAVTQSDSQDIPSEVSLRLAAPPAPVPLAVPGADQTAVASLPPTPAAVPATGEAPAPAPLPKRKKRTTLGGGTFPGMNPEAEQAAMEELAQRIENTADQQAAAFSGSAEIAQKISLVGSSNVFALAQQQKESTDQPPPVEVNPPAEPIFSDPETPVVFENSSVQATASVIETEPTAAASGTSFDSTDREIPVMGLLDDRPSMRSPHGNLNLRTASVPNPADIAADWSTLATDHAETMVLTTGAGHFAEPAVEPAVDQPNPSQTTFPFFQSAMFSDFTDENEPAVKV